MKAEGRKLEGKVAIVTGASYGIGRGIAVRFGAEGAKVVVNYRQSEGRAKETARMIEACGSQVLVVKADVSQQADVEAMVAQTLQAFGHIDILVNNAGVVTMSPITEMTEAIWDQVIDTDLKGTFFCTGAVAREMVKAGKGGKIVNISSVHAYRPQEQRAHYAAAKAGMVNMTKEVALELAPYRINVNCISPGAIETGMGEQFSSSPEEMQKTRDWMARTIPWGRVGLPEDCANLALFLVSDEADYCTGADFIIDGGLLLLHSGV